MKVRRGSKQSGYEAGDSGAGQPPFGGGAFGASLRKLADAFERDRREHADEHARLFAILQALRAQVDRIEDRLAKLLRGRSA